MDEMHANMLENTMMQQLLLAQTGASSTTFQSAFHLSYWTGMEIAAEDDPLDDPEMHEHVMNFIHLKRQQAADKFMKDVNSYM